MLLKLGIKFLEQGLQFLFLFFPVQGQVTIILGFVGNTVCHNYPTPCCGTKATTDNVNN